MKRTIKKRAAEPSTWAGIAGVVAGIAAPLAMLFGLDPMTAQGVGAVLGTLTGGAAICLPEKARF